MKRSSGFTLIEISVVMVLMMLLAGLIAPLTAREIDKSNARVEFLSFKNVLKEYSAKAFTRGTAFRIDLDGKTISIFNSTEEVNHTFDYISFPQQSFLINGNGFPAVDEVTVDVLTQTRIITYADILGVRWEDAFVTE